MKLKHIIFFIISLICFSRTMAETSYSPIKIISADYDYSVAYNSLTKRYEAKGTFLLNFYVAIQAERYDVEISWPPFNHTVRYIATNDPYNQYLQIHADEIFDYCSLTVLYFEKDSYTLVRLDDYPIYVKDYLSPEDYKLIYGDSGVTGIDDDGVSIIKTGDDIVVRSTDSDIQEIRGCDMTGRNILSLPLSTDSSEIMIDRNRLCHGLNILSVFRRGQPTKSFKIMN